MIEKETVHGPVPGNMKPRTPNRRAHYANRARSSSNGSTRGAFGNISKNGNPPAVKKTVKQIRSPGRVDTSSDIENNVTVSNAGKMMNGSIGNAYNNASVGSRPKRIERNFSQPKIESMPPSSSPPKYERYGSLQYSADEIPTKSGNTVGLLGSDIIEGHMNVSSGRIPQQYGSIPASDHHMIHQQMPPEHQHMGMYSQGPPYSGPYYDMGPSNQPPEPGVFNELFKTLFYDTDQPEFTSLQQFSWAIIIGLLMGVFTAKWSDLIEFCVEFVWKDIPETLYEWGVFTNLEGPRPLPHYMWVCPAVFGGTLSYIAEALPTLPGQNEWIETLHRTGVMNNSFKDFIQLILISTGGMASGLSLGPELPLVLASGMVGSYLGLVTHQSVLSARVMNLTTASAAIGGFFGFPMAGALFVLEIPHRMGLQYFEALSPATIASIIAVLTNRIITRDDLSGMFTYPFLTNSLPSNIFYIALVYGGVGSFVGVLYTKWCLSLKGWVHDWFHFHEHHDHDYAIHDETHNMNDKIPLVGDPNLRMKMPSKRFFPKFSGAIDVLKSKIAIKHEPTRAAAAGVIAGTVVGLVCMFLPHNLFWGEAQLQNLIDRGRTPLPIFGEGEEPTAMLTAYGYCLIDPKDEEAIRQGFSIGCAGLITLTKIFVIGLSLGTGIVGGHFWGPLFVGCAAAQFFTDLMSLGAVNFPGLQILSAYPCVAILCIMSSTHVVIYRAHMSIMLILTLSISAFSPDMLESAMNNYLGGDYSAVFPLLVVSCFIPLMCTRGVVFYAKQRSRGDIMATPEVLCEPGKEGVPLFPMHTEIDDVSQNDDSDLYGDLPELQENDNSNSYEDNANWEDSAISQQEIDKRFQERTRGDPLNDSSVRLKIARGDSSDSVEYNNSHSSDKKSTKKSEESRGRTSERGASPRVSRSRSSSRVSIERLGKVSTYGEITDFQPDLFSQARERASSVSRSSPSPMIPKKGRHSRNNSRGSYTGILIGNNSELSGMPGGHMTGEENLS